MEKNIKKKNFSRRKVLIGAGATLAAPAILSMTRAYAANPKLKVGFVSPKTGPLGGFAEADDYVVGAIQKVFSSGLSNNGKTYEVEIISKDSQSNPNRAAEVASDLILRDEVDIILAQATPDTTNPVAAKPTVESTVITLEPTETSVIDFVIPGIVKVPSIRSLSLKPTNSPNL